MHRRQPKAKAKKRRDKIAVIQKAVLYALAAAGGLTIALVAPNALQVLEQFGWVKTKRSAKDTINKSVERLLRAGLVTKGAKGFIDLTAKGRKRFSEIERADYQLPKPEKWDGKWRLVSFDIKEKRKDVRELLRATLSAVGFVHLHHSVWVYPHDCEDFLSLLKADYHVGVEILYIIAEYIENDRWLRVHFEVGEFKRD
ncbi:MAG: hypothetical protein Q7R93_05700 [bacterium]|nr:hypothetical protein [bacterium]